jgi:hypothetical protein
MEQNLVKQQTTSLAFVENAKESIENMLKYADVLLKSGLCPHHLYEKGADRKPDFAKGNSAAVVMILQQGFEIGLSPMQALQAIVPVNGLTTIKGDDCKALIFRSGVLVPDSWVETFEGNIENETYKVSITAKRKDNGIEKTSSFSVSDAKRADLWIPKSKVDGQDGWKYKLSPWFRYPSRMVYYRCLGYIARDLFSDVIKGLYTMEEAMDIPRENATNIELPNGNKIIIPNKEHNAERSRQLTQKAAEEIKNNGIGKQQIIEPEKEIPEENKPAQEIQAKALNLLTDLGVLNTRVYTMEELKKMETPELLSIVDSVPEMNKAKDKLPKKNTSNKLVRIIELYQAGKLAETVKQFTNPEITEVEFEEPNDDLAKQGELTGISKEEVNDDLAGVIKPNENFETEGSNKFNITFPPLEERKADFKKKKELYDKLYNEANIDNKKYLVLLEKFPQLSKYRNIEEFCGQATDEEVNFLLNSME